MTNGDDFFELYDDLTGRLSWARHQDFDTLLIEWFDMIEEGPSELVAAYRRLLELAPWHEVSKEVEDPDGPGMVGSSNFRWPRDRERKLAAQLSLFRHIADSDEEAWSYFRHYFYSNAPSVDDSVRMMTTHLFDPFARDLRRRFQRAMSEGRVVEPLPSDTSTILTLDHSSDAARAANDAIDEFEALASSSNSIDPQTKDRLLAEIRSGKELLKAATVRIEALKSVLLSGLAWAAKEFAGTAFGIVATAAITAITAWLGLGGLLP